jgi:hypothetical protein
MFAAEHRVGSVLHILVFCLLTGSLALQVLKRIFREYGWSASNLRLDPGDLIA